MKIYFSATFFRTSTCSLQTSFKPKTTACYWSPKDSQMPEPDRMEMLAELLSTAPEQATTTDAWRECCASLLQRGVLEAKKQAEAVEGIRMLLSSLQLS